MRLQLKELQNVVFKVFVKNLEFLNFAPSLTEVLSFTAVFGIPIVHADREWVLKDQ